MSITLPLTLAELAELLTKLSEVYKPRSLGYSYGNRQSIPFITAVDGELLVTFVEKDVR